MRVLLSSRPPPVNYQVENGKVFEKADVECVLSICVLNGDIYYFIRHPMTKRQK